MVVLLRPRTVCLKSNECALFSVSSRCNFSVSSSPYCNEVLGGCECGDRHEYGCESECATSIAGISTDTLLSDEMEGEKELTSLGGALELEQRPFRIGRQQ